MTLPRAVLPGAAPAGIRRLFSPDAGSGLMATVTESVTVAISESGDEPNQAGAGTLSAFNFALAQNVGAISIFRAGWFSTENQVS